MLTKPAIVTVIPAIAGREYRAASEVCYTVPPAGTGGDGGIAPPPSDGSSVYVPTAGESILLVSASAGVSTSVGPAPVGYVCVLQDPYNITPYRDGYGTTYMYPVVCTGP